MKHASAYFAIELFVIGSSEWKTATEHGIEKYSQSPDVSRRSCILYFTHDLWSHVAGGPTEDLDLSVIRNAGAEAKINDLERVAVPIKQQVL